MASLVYDAVYDYEESKPIVWDFGWEVKIGSVSGMVVGAIMGLLSGVGAGRFVKIGAGLKKEVALFLACFGAIVGGANSVGIVVYYYGWDLEDVDDANLNEFFIWFVACMLVFGLFLGMSVGFTLVVLMEKTKCARRLLGVHNPGNVGVVFLGSRRPRETRVRQESGVIEEPAAVLKQ